MQNTIHMAVDLPGPQAGAMKSLGLCHSKAAVLFLRASMLHYMVTSVTL